MSWLHGVATRLRLMLSSLGAISLDLKLGIRMLAKYPGLAFVGVLGISVAVVIGALAFTAAALFDSSALPLDEGERVVAIQNFDLRRDTREFAPHVHDLAIFRETLRAVEDIAGYRVVGRNLITADAGPGAVSVAEVNASVFRLARVSPMRGRYRTDDDEREAAPPVAVIAYDTWQQRLGGRADVIGTTVQIGALRHTVVGVMPSGFAFPVNNQLWVPLRLDRSPYEHGDGPTINVVARLAPGASHADVHAQLATLGQRLGVEYPNAHEHIRPRALPYHRVLVDLHPQVFHLARVVVALLLVVIATNVAVRVYARTARRASELAVRTALGPQRRSVVMQLFSEALVLSGAAAVVGMAITHFIFERINTLVEQYAGDQFPNWMRLDLTTGVVVRISALAIVSAVIIGVLPALKATRYRLFENLKHLSGNSSMRLGRTWTALLVAQVAVSV